MGAITVEQAQQRGISAAVIVATARWNEKAARRTKYRREQRHYTNQAQELYAIARELRQTQRMH